MERLVWVNYEYWNVLYFDISVHMHFPSHFQISYTLTITHGASVQLSSVSVNALLGFHSQRVPKSMGRIDVLLTSRLNGSPDSYCSWVPIPTLTQHRSNGFYHIKNPNRIWNHSFEPVPSPNAVCPIKYLSCDQIKKCSNGPRCSIQFSFPADLWFSIWAIFMESLWTNIQNCMLFAAQQQLLLGLVIGDREVTEYYTLHGMYIEYCITQSEVKNLFEAKVLSLLIWGSAELKPSQKKLQFWVQFGFGSAYHSTVQLIGSCWSWLDVRFRSQPESWLVGTDLNVAITWVGLGLCAAEPHHFSSCLRVN